MKKLIILLLLSLSSLSLSGCYSAKNVSNDYILPAGLKDCSVHQLGDTMSKIIVVRCPNSQTTTHYSVGKAVHSNTLIED